MDHDIDKVVTLGCTIAEFGLGVMVGAMLVGQRQAARRRVLAERIRAVLDGLVIQRSDLAAVKGAPLFELEAMRRRFEVDSAGEVT